MVKPVIAPAEPIADAEQEVAKGAVLIGARWHPGHVRRIDSRTGFYEELNSAPCDQLQTALLGVGRRQGRSLFGAIGYAAIAAICIAYLIRRFG